MPLAGHLIGLHHPLQGVMTSTNPSPAPPTSSPSTCTSTSSTSSSSTSSTRVGRRTTTLRIPGPFSSSCTAEEHEQHQLRADHVGEGSALVHRHEEDRDGRSRGGCDDSGDVCSQTAAASLQYLPGGSAQVVTPSHPGDDEGKEEEEKKKVKDTAARSSHQDVFGGDLTKSCCSQHDEGVGERKNPDHVDVGGCVGGGGSGGGGAGGVSPCDLTQTQASSLTTTTTTTTTTTPHTPQSAGTGVPVVVGATSPSPSTTSSPLAATTTTTTTTLQNSSPAAAVGCWQGAEIVPVLKRRDSPRDSSSRTRSNSSGSSRSVSLSEPLGNLTDTALLRREGGGGGEGGGDSKTSSVSSTFSDTCDEENHSRTTTSTTTTDDPSAAGRSTVASLSSSQTATTPPTPPASRQRRISFPADSVLTAVIQDGDTGELLRILTGRHAPGLVQRTGAGGEARGVDVRASNHVGLTALHHAVLANNVDAAKLLLCHGADVNAQDVHGFSPLHTAAACGFLPLTSLLLLFGADVWATTLDLELPIDLAKELRVVRLLAGEMTRLVHQELWLTSLVRTRAEEAWLLLRKLLACVLLLVLQVCVAVRTCWRGRGKRHRKSD
ncbi:uncharacterized protein LOC143295922 [Babylonia areolata]|uniref:uncharacterized protein LOC143295922 n=1 Tax=Babylonia areolata TaxID=304850 RepID=UPI003FD44BE7